MLELTDERRVCLTLIVPSFFFIDAFFALWASSEMWTLRVRLFIGVICDALNECVLPFSSQKADFVPGASLPASTTHPPQGI